MTAKPQGLSPKAGAVAGGVLLIGGLIYGSDRLMTELGNFEGDGQNTVYADQIATPKGLPTVCKGITRHVTDTPIIVGEYWPDEKCEREERAAVIKVQFQLRPCFKRQPPQEVFDTATSHAWNFGAGKTCGSLAMQAWNAGDWALGCRRLLQSDSGKLVWVYSGGKFYPGLKTRRTRERNWCMEGAR